MRLGFADASPEFLIICVEERSLANHGQDGGSRTNDSSIKPVEIRLYAISERSESWTVCSLQDNLCNQEGNNH
jgi:hypothetical protein